MSVGSSYDTVPSMARPDLLGPFGCTAYMASQMDCAKREKKRDPGEDGYKSPKLSSRACSGSWSI